MAENETSYDPFGAEQFANPFVTNTLAGLATLPKRAIQNSQYSLDTGAYDPAVPVEAATTVMGGGLPMAEAGAVGSSGGLLGKQFSSKAAKQFKGETFEALNQFKRDKEGILGGFRQQIEEAKRPADPVEKARLERGYTEPAYRGVKIYPGKELGPVQNFEHSGELYSTADPMLADMYSDYLTHHPGQHVPEGAFNEGATVMPLWIDTSKYHYVDAGGKKWTYVNLKAIDEAKREGKPGVIIDNVWDEPNSTMNLAGPKKIFITLPTGAHTVKSKFATKFDPQSPNMMHGVAAIGMGGPAGYVSMMPSDVKAGAMEQKPQDNKQQSSGGDMPKMSPGVMKWMMEFLKSNPDIAREISTRMNAVINGKQIQAQQGKGAPPPQQGQMPQQPMQQPMQPQQPPMGMQKPPGQ